MSIHYTDLVSRSWRIIWHAPTFWLLGFGFAAITVANSMMYPTVGPLLTGNPILYMELFGITLQRSEMLLTAPLLLVLLSLVSAVTQSSIISGAEQAERTQSAIGLGRLLRLGIPHLVPVWLLNALFSFIHLLLLVSMLVILLLGYLHAESLSSVPTHLLDVPWLVFVPVLGILFFLVAFSIVQQYALRALILDHAGILESIGAGWQVLFTAVRPTLIVLLLQTLIGMALLIALLVVAAPFVWMQYSILFTLGHNPVTTATVLLLSVMLWGISAAVWMFPTAFLQVLWTQLYLRVRPAAE